MKLVTAWLFIIVGTFAGIIFLALIMTLYQDYLNCSYGKEGCYDMLVGPAVFGLLSAPCWALSSFGVYLIRDKISKPIRTASYTFCAVMFFSAFYFLTVL